MKSLMKVSNGRRNCKTNHERLNDSLDDLLTALAHNTVVKDNDFKTRLENTSFKVTGPKGRLEALVFSWIPCKGTTG